MRIDMDKVGWNIRIARMRKGMSQTHLAQRTGIRAATLSAWERGRVARPQLANALAIARELDVTVEALVFGDLARIDTNDTHR